METTLLQWKVPDEWTPFRGHGTDKIWRPLTAFWRGAMPCLLLIAIGSSLWCGHYIRAFAFGAYLLARFSTAATPKSVQVTTAGLELGWGLIVTRRVPWSQIEYYRLLKPTRPHLWHLSAKVRRGKKIIWLDIPIDERSLPIESLRGALHQHLALEKERR